MGTRSIFVQYVRNVQICSICSIFVRKPGYKKRKIKRDTKRERPPKVHETGARLENSECGLFCADFVSFLKTIMSPVSLKPPHSLVNYALVTKHWNLNCGRGT